MNKPSITSFDTLSVGYIGVSLLGLGLLVVLTFTATLSRITFPLQTQATGLIFTGICLLGIMIGVFPSRCARLLHFRSQDEAVDKTEPASVRRTTVMFRGHHPTCGVFSTHVLHVEGATYCAGCMGLVTGGVISLIGCFSYFFLGFGVGEAGGYAFGIGVGGVVCGLLQYHLFKGSNGTIHFLLNVVFVVGAFLLLLGVNAQKSNFALEAYLLALMVFWIFSRMTLSQREHTKVCAACGVQSCGYW